MTDSTADDANSTETKPTRRTILGGALAAGLAALSGGAAAQDDDGDDDTGDDDTGGGDDGDDDTGTDDNGDDNGDDDDDCLRLSSSAFDHQGSIPTQYTCDGENASPPLRISGVPDDAEALALVVDDPDAPRDVPFTHWLVWNLPPDATELPEGVPTTETLDDLGGARQGTNGAGEVGYTGPCPPEGTHTYRFRLYALDSSLDLEAGAERQAVVRAVADGALAVALLTGEYSRSDG